MRSNIIKRIYKNGRRYIITELPVNKQNMFAIEDITEKHVRIVGFEYNVRNALRVIKEDKI